jgi:GT2 family glycosyltransferase
LLRCSADEGIAADVVVVDNAGSDGSADMVAERYPGVALLRSERNQGFAAGTNRGLRHLGYASDGADRPVLLLNPDTEVLPGALTLLLDDLARLPRAALVGPGLRYGDGRMQHAAFRFPGLAQTALEFFPINWRLTEGRANGRYPRQERGDAPFLCDHTLGAAMLVRSEALRHVGLLDDGFFMYCEEIDWCWRAARLGWQVWSDPRAVIVHHAGQSAGQVRGPMFVELWRSRYRLLARHRGRAYVRLIRAIVAAGARRERARAATRLRAGIVDEAQHREMAAAYTAVLAL